jgi:hypothetical protein
MTTTALEKQQALPEIPDRPAVAATEMVGMFERLATNPAVPVEKLEKLIELQERIMRHDAKSAFDAAFAEMQGEIPEITERGEISVNGQVRSKYAKFEDILREVKPILTKFGFAIRHRNVFDNGTIKIVGILSHRSGHSEEDEFVAKADDSGSKNAIQALGSTRSYGQRYTTISLLNIATRGADDDGQRSTKATAPEEPKGYEDWLLNMEAVADEGLARLQVTFQQSDPKFRQYLTTHDKGKHLALKAKAGKVVAK